MRPRTGATSGWGLKFEADVVLVQPGVETDRQLHAHALIHGRDTAERLGQGLLDTAAVEQGRHWRVAIGLDGGQGITQRLLVGWTLVEG